MRKLFWLCWYLAAGLVTHAQHSVTFRIQSLPAYHKPTDPVFLAGSFNNWNPGQKSMQFDWAGGAYLMTVSLKPGKYEYKLTRGSWETVEAGSEGASAGNRLVEVLTDTLIEVSVPHWTDHFPKQRVSTANKQVQVVDTAFYIPQL